MREPPPTDTGADNQDPVLGPLTILYTDSGAVRPRQTDDPVAIVGYVILPEIDVPKRAEVSFQPDSSQIGWLHRLGDGSVPRDAVVLGQPTPYATITATSTATASTTVPMDVNFLANAEPLPFDLEDLAKSTAGKGSQVWDVLAYEASLRRLSRLGVRGPLLHRTDGELPRWIKGEGIPSSKFRGEPVFPPLLARVREIESALPPIRRESVRGKGNLADSGPIAEVKRRAKLVARRVA